MAQHLSTDCPSELVPHMLAIVGCQNLSSKRTCRSISLQDKDQQTSCCCLVVASIMCHSSVCNHVRMYGCVTVWTLLNLTWVDLSHYYCTKQHYSKGVDSYRAMAPLFCTLTGTVRRTLHCVHTPCVQKGLISTFSL